MSDRYIGVGDFYPSPEAIFAVMDVLKSRRISYGPYSKKFEQEFAKLHQRQFGVLSNSGTSSLLVALQTLKELGGWNDGDEVIVPAITFVATVNVILHCNLTPVLVDIEKDFYCIDCTLIEQAITPKTKAIIPVHMFGQPADMCYVNAIAQHHNLKVIEDSCEAMFVKHRDKPVGAWGDIACFSTYVAHLITTGVGGVAITDNPEYAEVMRSLVNHGRDNIYISIDDSKGDRVKEVIGKRFSFERVGHSFRITELEAALGLAQLEDYHFILDPRQQWSFWYDNGLSEYKEYLQLPKIREDSEHAWMMYPIICKQLGLRDMIVQHLESWGIETRRMMPITNQPVYAGMFNEDNYPVAKWINEGGFYIGIHQYLTNEDVEYVIEKFGEFEWD